MAWWGKIAGGTFGFILGGPLGAMLGAALGHNFDKGLDSAAVGGGFGGVDQERIQSAFFTAVFSVMGHIAKADGRVSPDEISMARAVMQQMSLDAAQTRVAMDLFNQGKSADFELDTILAQFKSECHRRRTLMQMFVEILLHAAYADGVLHADETRILKHISHSLGFSAEHFQQLEAAVRAQRFFSEEHLSAGASSQTLLKDAYALLGVAEDAADSDVKKAYRRMMNQHHPDKLVAKGLPEEMLKLATEKTQEIKAAYELIKRHRQSQ